MPAIALKTEDIDVVDSATYPNYYHLMTYTLKFGLTKGKHDHTIIIRHIITQPLLQGPDPKNVPTS